MALQKYRKSMGLEVTHAWAEDAEAKIAKQNEVLTELMQTLKPTYESSPEGRAYLEKIKSVIDL
jgi:hypothetical protein